MEEDIKILEEIIKFSKEQFENTGIYTHLNDKEILAIEHLIARNKELEKYYENEKVIWSRKDYIPKSKVREKIEELIKQGDYRTADNPTGRIHFHKEPEDYQIAILQELLED